MADGPHGGDDLEMAHAHCFSNRSELLASDSCGCFCCVATYSPSEITDWIDEPEEPLFKGNRLMPQVRRDQTAICPRCGVDSVIGPATR